MARKTSLADALPDRPHGGQPAVDPATLSETGSRARRVLPVDLASIEIPPRLRAVNPETVSALADSIARISLQNPIILQKHPDDPGLLVLVAGAHRLLAVRELGWPRIEALIVDGSPEEIGLIEIDENLIRKDLTPLDRARFLAKRKAIYAKLYRASGRGGDRRSAGSADDGTDRVTASTSWAQDAADLVGISPRAVHRAVAIGTGLSDELADALANTPIAKREGDLFRLAQMSAKNKKRVLHQLQNPDVPRSSLSRLMGPEPGLSKPDRVQRLQREWSAASPDERHQFFSWIQASGWPPTNPDGNTSDATNTS
ncbi:MAG: ParB N-terminal domain-containing protein [Defluviicoccus sp.]|nr:ParB N-terminal domain-containing protein [Defluviicoccus sp.]MDE0277430.1 ParB N-terminal domain-containing protein [Defluviicoccus sp.]